MNTSVHPYGTCRRKDGQTYIPTVAWSIKSWVDITTRHFIRSCIGSGSFGNPSTVACILLFDKRGHPILHSKYHSVIWCFVFRWLVHFESNHIWLVHWLVWPCISKLRAVCSFQFLPNKIDRLFQDLRVPNFVGCRCLLQFYPIQILSVSLIMYLSCEAMYRDIYYDYIIYIDIC